VQGCPIDTVPPMGHVEKGNGGPFTGAGSPRNAGAGTVGFAAAGGHQSSEYAFKSRRRKLPRSVLVLSDTPPAPAGVDCP
ncbi:MAG: hypothetical protein WA795_04050, partial [Candidatus Sulfotelmatobacter sp.]